MESAAITPALASAVDPGGTSVVSLEAGYGASLGGDARAFAGAIDRAGGSGPLDGASPAAEIMLEPLEHINREAVSLAEFAEEAMASGNELTPGEIVSLTARSQEFMFHAQLTANVANRTADGLSQLFRQQS